MYVLINAIDADEDRGWELVPGKSTSVEPDMYEITPRGDDLLIRAEVKKQYGTGDRGGTPKTVVRRLVMNLNKQDLQKIAEAARALR